MSFPKGDAVRDGVLPSKQSPISARRLLRKAWPEPVEGYATKEQGFVVRYSYRLAMVKQYKYRGTLHSVK
jgi:hypothetical protein